MRVQVLFFGVVGWDDVVTPRRVVEPRSCGWGTSQGVRLCAEQIFPEESAEAENSGETENTQKTVTSTNLSCR
jgi:hypothetical protein